MTTHSKSPSNSSDSSKSNGSYNSKIHLKSLTQIIEKNYKKKMVQDNVNEIARKEAREPFNGQVIHTKIYLNWSMHLGMDSN